MPDHEIYASPFSWRYGSEEMRHVWSEARRRRLWRRIWVALAEAQAELGLVRPEEAEDLRAHAANVDVRRALDIEAEIEHDLMSEVRAYAEQCLVGGRILHLGATSMDVKDNADVLRIREALDLLLGRLRAVLSRLADRIEERADQACVGYTHLQPAEPTTVGYRLAQVGQDLLADLEELERVQASLKGKGLRGATGTSASFAQLLDERAAGELERRVLEKLQLEAFPVVTQTYPRKQDWLVLNALAGLAATLYRWAFDLRVLQAAPYGEWSEPFAEKQVGSSAMPFKRNPVNAEALDSLARWVATLPRVAWDNAAHSLLERTLDDSANRRLILPEAFLASDELLRRAARILRGLVIHDEAVARNLRTYGIFAATERLLMELVKAGADRQQMHEGLRRHSLAAWDAVRRGEPNGLVEALAADPAVLAYLSAGQVRSLLGAAAYVGDAPQRARRMAQAIRAAITPSSPPGRQPARGGSG